MRFSSLVFVFSSNAFSPVIFSLPTRYSLVIFIVSRNSSFGLNASSVRRELKGASAGEDLLECEEYESVLVDSYAALGELEALEAPALLLHNERAQMLAYKATGEHYKAFGVAAQLLTASSASSGGTTAVTSGEMLEALHSLGCHSLLPAGLQTSAVGSLKHTIHIFFIFTLLSLPYSLAFLLPNICILLVCCFW